MFVSIIKHCRKCSSFYFLITVLSFQNNLYEHVISLERGDFKLSIGSLNNKFKMFIILFLDNVTR